MPDAISKSGNFTPIHSAHAIEQVAFIVQITPPLSESDFSELKRIAKQFKVEADLPREIQTHGFAITFGAEGPEPLQSQEGAGFILQRTGPSGIPEKDLRIEPNSITYRSMVYTRWEDNWEQACKYLNALVPIYTKNAKVEAIGLNYVDKFAWNGNPLECKANALLRENSSYLSPQVFKAQDLWHNHSGAFIRVADHIKRLQNVNVSSADENRDGAMQRVVSIVTVLTDLLNQPGYEVSDVTGDGALAFIYDRMQHLHIENKNILNGLITDEMSRRISLAVNG